MKNKPSLVSKASKAPNKPQILALHGFTGCGSDFAGFSTLCGSDFDWTCPDLPGHGSRPVLSCTPAATINFLNQQTLGRPRILLGYSMGARAALLHAVRYPSHWDALIFISINPGIEVESERKQRALNDQKLAQKIIDKGVPKFLSYWRDTPIIRSQRKIRKTWRANMQANRLKHTAEGLSASLRQFGLSTYPNLWPVLSKLNCPVLLITGEHDTKYCNFSKRVQQLISQSEWQQISKAGHMPHLEAPEKTADTIRGFLHDIFISRQSGEAMGTNIID